MFAVSQLFLFALRRGHYGQLVRGRLQPEQRLPVVQQAHGTAVDDNDQREEHPGVRPLQRALLEPLGPAEGTGKHLDARGRPQFGRCKIRRRTPDNLLELGVGLREDQRSDPPAQLVLEDAKRRRQQRREKRQKRRQRGRSGGSGKEHAARRRGNRSADARAGSAR